MTDEILLKQIIEEQIKHNDEFKQSDYIGNAFLPSYKEHY
jgi:hypothetical protein